MGTYILRSLYLAKRTLAYFSPISDLHNGTVTEFPQSCLRIQIDPESVRHYRHYQLSTRAPLSHEVGYNSWWWESKQPLDQNQTW